MRTRTGRTGGRRLAMATAACLLALPAFAQSATAATTPRIAQYQEVVTLLTKHSVRDRPRIDAESSGSVSARRPITRQRTVLPVLAQAIDERGRSWLRVRLPGRALNAKTPPRDGWITASNTRASTTAWHIVVDVRARRVIVYHDGQRLRSYRAIVGKSSTPTPRGKYFVEENVALPRAHSGAPFALALSARSKVFQEFEGGPGQIALHGVDNIGGTLGTAVSHGCVRLAGSAVRWLAARIKPGVPVTIR